MNQFEINGVALEYDFSDADRLEMFEDEMAKVQEAAGNVPPGRDSEQIRYVCNVVRGCYSALFGDELCNRVFGARHNLTECIEAFDQLVCARKDAVKQVEAVSQKITQKHTAANRSQRRAKK